MMAIPRYPTLTGASVPMLGHCRGCIVRTRERLEQHKISSGEIEDRKTMSHPGEDGPMAARSEHLQSNSGRDKIVQNSTGQRHNG